jgi:hypothetical protein
MVEVDLFVPFLHHPGRIGEMFLSPLRRKDAKD